jgi:hypothetical protein
MGEQRTHAPAIDRVSEAVRSRRALVSGSLAALGIVALGNGEETAAGKRRNRRRRRRGRNAGLGTGNCRGVVCQNASDGPNCQFSSIQAAIDAVTDQPAVEEIDVCPGVYNEQIVVNPLLVSNLTVRATSSSPSATTIDASGQGTALTVNRGAFIEFDGFTVTGGKAAFGAGVANRGFLTLKNCVITKNDTGAADDSGGGGIYNDGGELTLSLTEIVNNHALDGQGGGILNVGGKVALQELTQVLKNMADRGGGLFNQGGTVTIDGDSVVTGNEPDNCLGTSACGA